jgi:hypothetical protein
LGGADAISNLPAPHVGSKRGHLARDFMSKHKRRRIAALRRTAADQNVTTADTAGANTNEDLTTLRFGLFDLAHRKNLGSSVLGNDNGFQIALRFLSHSRWSKAQKRTAGEKIGAMLAGDFASTESAW